jgi:hypothetical protein
MDAQRGDDEVLRNSMRLAAVSRRLAATASSHIDCARHGLDKARNVVQVAWLLRALRQRERGDHHRQR